LNSSSKYETEMYIKVLYYAGCNEGLASTLYPAMGLQRLVSQWEERYQNCNTLLMKQQVRFKPVHFS